MNIRRPIAVPQIDTVTRGRCTITSKSMISKLSEYIANALERAEAAEKRARDVRDPELRSDNQLMAESWRLLARSFQLVESLQQVEINSKTTQQQDWHLPEPSKRHPWE
jgi:hypothetical protein